MEDPDVSCEDDLQHCIICCDSITTSTSVGLHSGVTTVTGPTSKCAVGERSLSGNQSEDQDTSDPIHSVYGTSEVADSQPHIQSVKAVLSAILQSLQYPVPAGDVLCRPCCRLVVQVDRLRTQARTLEARLLARLNRGETCATARPAPVAARQRAGRTTRAARPRRPPPPETELESQNYITAAAAAAAPSAAAPSTLISIEIRREDSEQNLPESDAAGHGTSDPDSPDPADTDTGAAPAPAPAAASPGPPPVDPPPTYVRQEQNSQCGVCGLEFQTRIACRDHMRVHQAKKVYFCPLCPAALMARNALEAHEVERHADSALRPYGCGQCAETFPTPRFLRRHKDAVHGVVLPCAHCRRTFRRQEDLDTHQMVHTDQRPHTCNRCGKSFTKQPVWRQHLKTHGRRPRPFQCAQCPRAFLSALHLTVHSRRHRQAPLQCDQCERHFTSEARLGKHALTCSKKHACDVCGKLFSKRSLLADHARTHTGEKPFICEFCGVGFAQRSNLTAHKSAVHLNEKPFQCSICKKAFKRKLLLIYHERAIHSGERPARCPLCSASFVSPQQLQAHQKTHGTPARPHRCAVCSRSFGTEQRRHAHMVSAHSDRQSTAECPAPDGGQFVVQAVAADGSTIYEPVGLTVSQGRPPGEAGDPLQSLDDERS